MRAAVYARYSSENQRPESIADQVSACRRLAAEKSYVISDEHIYTDEAASGARKDRAGLNALLAASEGQLFDVVLVDDLSRLARDNFLMLSVLIETKTAATVPRPITAPGPLIAPRRGHALRAAASHSRADPAAPAAARIHHQDHACASRECAPT